MKEVFPIKYIGFTPSDAIRRRALDALDNIERLGPHGSSIFITMEWFNGKYTATCRVVSINTNIVSESTAPDPFESINEMESKALFKIDSWKSRPGRVVISPFYGIA